MVARPVAELAVPRDIEKTEFRSAAGVAVADHDHRIARDEHLVVPGTARSDVLSVGVRRTRRPQFPVGDPDGKKLTPREDDEVIAVHLDDSTFVDARVLY